MANGDSTDSGIPLLGPILDLLSSLFGSQDQVQGLADAVSEVEQNNWTNMLSLAGYAYGLFGDILGTLGDLIKSIGAALEHLIKDIIFGHLLALIKAILDFLHHLRDLIGPLIKYLQQLQKAYNAAVSQYMRQVIDLIQRIRKILVPFRLLHLAFATKLDAMLAGFESDLGKKWAALIRFNTQILGILNDVLDPRNLMRPGHVLGSLGMMIGAVRGAIGAADVRTLLCLGPLAKSQPLAQPWSTTQTTTITEINTHSGTFAVYEAQRDDTLRSLANDFGVTSIV